ncbi:TRAP transporter small permease [uncultured Sphaerochaeta sp.]|uniref:TRAP transporter small permease n=1 Tax=uncultured Sphaerochaeta sp. TaxID=886478 RepID=UPI002A0A4EE1|nr:TRAP transporter small permease [uncultured Sphaerochaeta sp.]
MKKAALFLRDIFEVYVPILSFSAMFITFILQVFFRYVMNHPLLWTQDVIVIGFCWTVIFGACYTMRQHSHVQFTMLYELYNPKVAAAARMVGNLLIVGTFAVMLVPSIQYSFFLGFQMTPVLRVSYTYIFLPFCYFLCSIIGYTIPSILEDWKVLSGKLADSVDHLKKMDVEEGQLV